LVPRNILLSDPSVPLDNYCAAIVHPDVPPIYPVLAVIAPVISAPRAVILPPVTLTYYVELA